MTPQPKIAALAASCLAAVVGLAAFYSGSALSSNSACTVTPEQQATLNKAATGEVAAFQVSKAPVSLSALGFNAPDGTKLTMEAFKGRTVLLNLWATWCVPCRKEMPALDTLQGELGGPAFEVVAVNIDTRNPDKARDWLKDNRIERLAFHADPEAKIFQELRRMSLAVGMPTTLIVDAKGCARGVLHGQAEWASADAKTLIRAAMAQ